MNKFIARLPKFNIYWLLFLATVAILLVKFSDIWLGSGPLAGYDTTGHYEAFLKQAELIKQGRLKGYFLNWFGGVPIFYFYSPLLFWLGGVLVVIFPFLAPTLIFRWLLLISLAALAPAFYYFSKTFLPIKPNPWFSWFLVILYLFFQPHVVGELGVGLSGAVAAGFINQAPGLVLGLMFLAFFKSLLDSQKNFWEDRYFYFSVISGTLLFYTHILSTLFVAIIAVLLGLFYLYRLETYYKTLAVLLFIATLSAYYLLPFLAYYQYSSGWGYRRGEGFFIDPLQPLLAIDLLGLLRGRWSNLNWPWLVVVISATGGFISLLKKGVILLPVLFLFPFIFIPRDYLPETLGFSLHFYRIMPILIILFMTASLYSFSLLEETINNNIKYRRYVWVLWLGLCLVALWRLNIYSFHPDKYNISSGVVISANDPYDYYPNLSDYPGSKSALALVNCILEQPSREGRVSIEHDLQLLMKETGSTHFFDYALPQAGQPILQGLYSESANQTAFIYPSFALISPQMADYNYPESNHLLWNNVFRANPPSEAIKQMGLFNVEYIVAYNMEANDNLVSIDEKLVQSVPCKNSWFSLYRIDDSIRRPFLSNPKFNPVLYVKGKNGLPFRDISLGWYTLGSVYDIPIIYSENLDLQDLSALPQNEKYDISAVVVGSNSLSKDEVNSLSEFNKPILVLSNSSYQGERPPIGSVLIENFLPTAGFNEYNEPYHPDTAGLKTFYNFLTGVINSGVADFEPEHQVETLFWEDESIAFSGSGPILINAGFFPAWQSRQKGQTVYEATPGQMLVFANNETFLEFRSTSHDRNGAFISIVSFIMLLALGFYNRNKIKWKSHTD